ncbi:hypothetical protein BDV06DRAFT_225573 [Aspergillus oleicola]
MRLITDGIANANEIRLADSAGGFGGTWYWNRFPGLHCDLESYVYLPLLEETGYVPSHKYSPGAEIKRKKIAVIGTAATAVGAIPEVAKYAGVLYVIQRTPASVKPRGQRPTDKEEFTSEVADRTGWQYQRQLNFNSFLTNSPSPGAKDLVNDGWTDMPGYSAILGSPKHGVIDPYLRT